MFNIFGFDCHLRKEADWSAAVNEAVRSMRRHVQNVQKGQEMLVTNGKNKNLTTHQSHENRALAPRYSEYLRFSRE